MATVVKQIEIGAAPTAVWDAVRDVGALHTRLVPGFVLDTRMLAGAEPPVRRVTFASGAMLDETIVTVDDDEMRLVWSIRGEGVHHHNGALRVEACGPGARVDWTADVSPTALADRFAPLMAQGLQVMKATLEAAQASDASSSGSGSGASTGGAITT